MYFEVWIDEDEILERLSKDRSEDLEAIRYEAKLDLLEELHYIYSMRGKQDMLDKLNFLMSDFKLQEMDL